MSLREMGGLSLDQAPPLNVVFPFFVAASLFMTAAGVLLAAEGAAVLSTPWTPATLGLTHLVTLGFLMMVMMGAVYQMIPVVLGVPVPAVRLAHVVFTAMAAGVTSLVVGLALSSSRVVMASVWLLGLGLTVFLAPTLWSAWRAPAKTQTANGIRFALLCLLGVGSLGILMAQGHAGATFPGDRWLFIRAHLALGLLGWVGSLLVAVSWQVVPMFYLARPVPEWQRRVILGALVLGASLPPLGLSIGGSFAEPAVRYGPLPAVIALFVLHPAVTLKSIRDRRRKRAHPSVLFFQAGLSLAPLVAVAAGVASEFDAPRWDLLYGFLALFGWAAAIVHGMLSRIVPFLVWFHRFSPLAGFVPIPSMNGLLPARWTRTGLGLHAAAVALGAAGIISGQDLILRAAGVLVASTGLSVAAMIAHVWRQRPEPTEGPGSSPRQVVPRSAQR